MKPAFSLNLYFIVIDAVVLHRFFELHINQKESDSGAHCQVSHETYTLSKCCLWQVEITI